MTQLTVGDVVKLKTPIEWLRVNEWIVEKPPIGNSVQLRHRTRRAYYTLFRLDEIDVSPVQPGGEHGRP